MGFFFGMVCSLRWRSKVIVASQIFISIHHSQQPSQSKECMRKHNHRKRRRRIPVVLNDRNSITDTRCSASHTRNDNPVWALGKRCGTTGKLSLDNALKGFIGLLNISLETSHFSDMVVVFTIMSNHARQPHSKG